MTANSTKWVLYSGGTYAPWYTVVSLIVPWVQKGHKDKDKCRQKTTLLATVGALVNRTLFSGYPCSQYIIYNNGSEFKLPCMTLCDSYGLKHKPTSVKNPQANAILKHVHQIVMAMLHTSERDMGDTINESDIADILTNAAWTICSTYHTVLWKPHHVQQYLEGTCCLTSHF